MASQLTTPGSDSAEVAARTGTPVRSLPWDSLRFFLHREQPHRRVVLGCGSLKPVFAAELSFMRVAIKVAGDLSEILPEAELLTAFAHEHVVRCYGIALRSSSPSRAPQFGLVMDLLHADMFTVLRHASEGDPSTDLPFLWRLRALRQLARGLAHLHSCSVIHRNISSRSVFLSSPDRGGMLQLGCLGNAFVPPHMNAMDTCVGDCTHEQSIYTAPELIACGCPLRCTFQSDVFAAGVLAWQVLSCVAAPTALHGVGAAPVPIPSMISTRFDAQQRDSGVPSMSFIPESMPYRGTLVEILRRCLLRDAADRFRSGVDLFETLDFLLPEFDAGAAAPPALRNIPPSVGGIRTILAGTFDKGPASEACAHDEDLAAMRPTPDGSAAESITASADYQPVARNAGRHGVLVPMTAAGQCAGRSFDELRLEEYSLSRSAAASSATAAATMAAEFVPAPCIASPSPSVVPSSTGSAASQTTSSFAPQAQLALPYLPASSALPNPFLLAPRLSQTGAMPYAPIAATEAEQRGTYVMPECPVCCCDDVDIPAVLCGCAAGAGAIETPHSLCMACALRHIRLELSPASRGVRCPLCLAERGAGPVGSMSAAAVAEVAAWSRQPGRRITVETRPLSDEELDRHARMAAAGGAAAAAAAAAPEPSVGRAAAASASMLPPGAYKLCPRAGCGARISRPRGHHCHHIAPGTPGGCPACHTHFCFACLHMYAPGDNFNMCPNGCPLFCTPACDCHDCTDCHEGDPCDDCSNDGSCWVCQPLGRPAAGVAAAAAAAAAPTLTDLDARLEEARRVLRDVTFPMHARAVIEAAAGGTVSLSVLGSSWRDYCATHGMDAGPVRLSDRLRLLDWVVLTEYNRTLYASIRGIVAPFEEEEDDEDELWDDDDDEEEEEESADDGTGDDDGPCFAAFAREELASGGVVLLTELGTAWRDYRTRHGLSDTGERLSSQLQAVQGVRVELGDSAVAWLDLEPARSFGACIREYLHTHGAASWSALGSEWRRYRTAHDLPDIPDRFGTCLQELAGVNVSVSRQEAWR